MSPDDVLRAAARVVTLGLLAGCGGGTEPNPPDLPIPSDVYSVGLSSPTNDCGADDAGSFTFLVIPQRTGDSYSLFGLTTRAEPATKVRDTLAFSVAAATESGTVTISGHWRFTPERHTFAGTTSFEVRITGLQPCTFVFATNGTHDITLSVPTLESTDATVSSTPATAMEAGRATIRAARGMRRPAPDPARASGVRAGPGLGWVFGTPGEVVWTSNTCFLSGAGTLQDADLTFAPPFPQSRSGQEYVAFRYEIHAAPNRDIATLEVLNEELTPYSSNSSIVATSEWWWSTVGPSGNYYGSLGFQVPWLDFVDGRSLLGFEGSNFKSWSLALGSVYYVTGDVYWYGHDNIPAGSHRRVIPMTAYAEQETFCVAVVG